MSTPLTARERAIRLICPACPAAAPEFLDSLDPTRETLQISCTAPVALQQAYGYGSVCQHTGPFLDPEEAQEWLTCPVLAALVASRRR